MKREKHLVDALLRDHLEMGGVIDIQEDPYYPQLDVIRFLLNGKLHRENGPAIIDGRAQSMKWLQNGVMHRNGYPAHVGKDLQGNLEQEWWQDGKRAATEDQASIVNATGQFWYVGTKLHRVSGPAVILKNKRQEWRQNGKYHRLDGPALIQANGDEKYYLFGKSATQEAIRAEAKKLALQTKPNQTSSVKFMP